MSLTQEQKDCVIHGYLPCTATCQRHEDLFLKVYLTHRTYVHYGSEYLGQPQLRLKPLSALTDAEAWVLNHFEDWWDYEELYTRVQKIKKGDTAVLLNWQSMEYLKKQKYAVPLFLAADHPLNGKNAVELGLAEYECEHLPKGKREAPAVNRNNKT